MTSGIAAPLEEMEAFKRKIVELIMDDTALTFLGAVKMLGEKAPKQSTLYKWRSEDKEWDKMINAAQSYAEGLVTQLCKNKLIDAVNEGDGKMIRFWLERKAKDEGFSQRVDLHTTSIRAATFKPENEVDGQDAFAQMNGSDGQA